LPSAAGCAQTPFAQARGDWQTPGDALFESHDSPCFAAGTHVPDALPEAAFEQTPGGAHECWSSHVAPIAAAYVGAGRQMTLSALDPWQSPLAHKFASVHGCPGAIAVAHAPHVTEDASAAEPASLCEKRQMPPAHC
jgi:hypothetical protein